MASRRLGCVLVVLGMIGLAPDASGGDNPLAVALALVVGGASRAAAELGWAEGQWIGGFEGVDGTVYVSAQLDAADAGQLTGTLELPLQTDGAVTLDRVTVTESSLRFDVRGEKTGLEFDGKRKDAGRIAGTVHQGRGSASFELLKVKTLSPERLDAIAGTYELEPGHQVLVARSPGGLIYVDQDRGRLGALFALDEQTLVGGPSLGAGYPIELKIEVPTPGTAPVDRILWSWRGHDSAVGTRRHPYHAEPVSFHSGSVRLSGTLLIPARPGPHPAVVMIHGSGPAIRDALWPWADMYARAGIAVLIHDKRGTGASTGSWATATFENLAEDAYAAVQLLQARRDIDARRVGLHGMSQGGWIAPLVAKRVPDLAFIIAESAPAMTPVEHERLRVPYQLAADGFPADAIARAVSFMAQKFEVARTGEGWDELQLSMARGAREGWLSYVNPPPSLENLRWNWEHILSYDPAPALEALTCPVLVLYGGLDSIVPAKVHKARMQAALDRARTHDVTIKVFDQANHAFLQAVTGGRRETAGLKGFVDGYFGTHIAWLSERLSLTPSGDRTSPSATSDAIARAITHLPKRPRMVAVIDANAAKPGVRATLLSSDAFTLRGHGSGMDPHRVVYLVKQSAVLREAAKGSRFFDHVLASIIWHEMAHLDGADERGARRAEQDLWTVFVRDGALDPVAALRYLNALAARPDDQLSMRLKEVTVPGAPAR